MPSFSVLIEFPTIIVKFLALTSLSDKVVRSDRVITEKGLPLGDPSLLTRHSCRLNNSNQKTKLLPEGLRKLF